jgi:tRNA wybutosine-synthesizing protein 3
MNTFEQDKQKQLAKEDKSNVGSWDEKIENLCNKLNKKKNYYTTSSCAGRVTLLKGSDKKMKDAFLFRTHDKISFDELKKQLDEVDFKGIVEYKQSPCILHVACKSLEDAQALVNKAKLSGWKHSGIMATKKRFVVELHSTENIAFPIMENKKMLVDDYFLNLIVKQSNEKLERVWEKIKRLESLM